MLQVGLCTVALQCINVEKRISDHMSCLIVELLASENRGNSVISCVLSFPAFSSCLCTSYTASPPSSGCQDPFHPKLQKSSQAAVLINVTEVAFIPMQGRVCFCVIAFRSLKSEKLGSTFHFIRAVSYSETLFLSLSEKANNVLD